MSALVACSSSTEIHLFADSQNADSIEFVSESLLEAGFKVSTNSRNIPGIMRRPTILYPPLIRDIGTIDQLQNILARHGYANINTSNLSIGNHHYSTDNIGIYLVSRKRGTERATEGETAKEEAKNTNIVAAATQSRDPTFNLAGIYDGVCAETDAYLNLYGNGVMLLEIIDWDEASNSEKSRYFDGEWSESKHQLTVSLFDSEPLVYVVSRLFGRSRYGIYRGIKLDLKTENGTASEMAMDCDFIFRDL